ncbi:MAG: alpha/beta fold hydrolase [Gammaproteobacteria bacterium TMED1]|nr:MAG: alpha/beta fold hydrolase [Gammaproteobacteria bacterium TMED1]
MPYLTHKFGRTYYTKRGRNTSIPIIYLHGGPGGSHQPDSPVFQLAEKRQVYAYTQIGSGKSSSTAKKFWNIRTFVQELDLLIRGWGLDQFHLMGSSWGTTLALEYYLRKGRNGVASLIFQSPLFNAMEWRKDGRRLIRGLPKATQKIINSCHEIGATDSRVYKEAMFQYYLKHVLRNKSKLKKKMSSDDPHGRAIYAHMWGVSEFEPTGTLKNFDRVADLSKIQVPSLIVCGEYDEATPKTSLRYANRIEDCSFEVIQGASHSIWSEQPARIRRVINAFLEKVVRS